MQHEQEVVSFVPSLAALFDRMTTPLIKQRFTAEEALAFFRDTTTHLSHDMLDNPVTLRPGFAAMLDANVYWSHVPPESLAIYGIHRTPPPSWGTRVLHWVLYYRIGYRLIVWLRRTLNI